MRTLENYRRVHRLYKRYQLAYKCRLRWRRRHMKGYIYLAQEKYDPIGVSLKAKRDKYYRLLQYISQRRSQ